MADGEPENDAEEVDEASVTASASYRHKYLSTVVTWSVVLSYSALILGSAFGVTATTNPGTWATYSLAFIACIAYSVGVDTLKAAADARG